MKTETLLNEPDLDESLATYAVTRRLRQIQEARKTRQSSSEARQITFVTHPHGRAHDFVAIYMFIEEAHRNGLIVGEYSIVADRSEVPEVNDPAKLFEMGVIPICAGSGPWSKVGKETAEHSVVLNTARFLRLLADPVWERLVQWVHSAYSPPGPGNFEKSLGLIRTLSLARMDDQLEAYLLAEAIFDSVRAEFMEETVAASDLAKIITNQDSSVHHKGRNIKMGMVRSDAPLLARLARREKKMDVLVRIDSTGHAIISGGRDIDFSRAVAKIREEEARRAGIAPPTTPGQPGLADSSDRWFYKRNQPEQFESILNGGFTHPGMPPTQIELEELGYLVFSGLEEE